MSAGRQPGSASGRHEMMLDKDVGITMRDVDRILKDPQLLRRLGEFGIYTDGAESPEAMGEFVRRELASWGKVVREIGLQPE